MSGVFLRLILVCQAVLSCCGEHGGTCGLCVQRDSLCLGGQAGLGSPSESVFPGFAAPLCSNSFMLESLARPLSDIQQNSNYTFSESGIQVYLENSPQNVGDLFTRHSLAGWIIEICPLWLCLCLEELVGQRRLLCLGKLLLVCHHPLWFLKSCRHWFMQLLEQTWPPL